LRYFWRVSVLEVMGAAIVNVFFVDGKELEEEIWY
jgi:hypothetical protein